MRDEADLEQIFEDNKIDAVIHFAGMKAVGESVEKPLEYYENNVSGTLTLLRVMRKYGCRTMIFPPAPRSTAVRIRCRTGRRCPPLRPIPMAIPR